MRFLSPAWIAALDAAVRSGVLHEGPGPHGDLIIQQRVVDDDADSAPEVVTYRFEVRADDARVLPGEAPAPDISLTVDRTTATAIAQGRLSAQQAFLEGQLRIEGDVSTVLDRRDLLARLGALTAAVRDEVEW